MLKTAGFDPPVGGFFVCGGPGPVGEVIAPASAAPARDFHKTDCLGFAGLKTNRRPRRDVEPFAISLEPVESQSAIGFDEMVVAADLDRPVAQIRYRKGHGFPARV